MLDHAEARLGAPVRVADAALEAFEPRLVEHLEDEERAHVRLLACELDRLAVVARLDLRIDRGHDLLAGVELRLVGRNARLDSVLAVDDRKGSAERLVQERDELAVVGNTDRGRVRMGERRRDAWAVAVDVNREL